jgi:SAM-dependent methyltransferase
MKQYDRAYFDRWYRDPRSRVKTPADVARKVRMAVAVTEFFLDRPVRSVLDVGCGEGAWLTPLRRLRPHIEYAGVDPSDYAVHRYGKRRNIRLGRVDTLDQLEWSGPFDLVVCVDVLNYVPARTLRRGLEQIKARMGGVAYLEIFSAADALEGDMRGWYRRPASYYERLMGHLGLTRCGPHCYVGSELAARTSSFERA